MDFHSLKEQYSPFVKQHWLPILLGFLGLIFFVYGLIVLFVSSGQNNSIVFEAGNESSNSQSDEKTTIIDVAGAVMTPGVYKLNADARVQDALIVAGGLSIEADRSWVSRTMNLAAKLQDGTKIYIPTMEESITHSSLRSSGQGGDVSGFININTASQSELESLPGIGAVTAQKIINNRPYASIDELLSKKIVGSKVFEKIKNSIAVY